MELLSRMEVLQMNKLKLVSYGDDLLLGHVMRPQQWHFSFYISKLKADHIEILCSASS